MITFHHSEDNALSGYPWSPYIVNKPEKASSLVTRYCPAQDGLRKPELDKLCLCNPNRCRQPSSPLLSSPALRPLAGSSSPHTWALSRFVRRTDVIRYQSCITSVTLGHPSLPWRILILIPFCSNNVTKDFSWFLGIMEIAQNWRLFKNYYYYK